MASGTPSSLSRTRKTSATPPLPINCQSIKRSAGEWSSPAEVFALIARLMETTSATAPREELAVGAGGLRSTRRCAIAARIDTCQRGVAVDEGKTIDVSVPANGLARCAGEQHQTTIHGRTGAARRSDAIHDVAIQRTGGRDFRCDGVVEASFCGDFRLWNDV